MVLPSIVNSPSKVFALLLLEKIGRENKWHERPLLDFILTQNNPVVHKIPTSNMINKISSYTVIHPLKKNALWKQSLDMIFVIGGQGNSDTNTKNTWGLFCTFSWSLVHTIWTDRPKRKTKCLPTTCKEGRWLCPPQFLQHSPLMTILTIVWICLSKLPPMPATSIKVDTHISTDRV